MRECFWDGGDCHIVSSTRWPVHRLVTHAGPARRTAHQTAAAQCQKLRRHCHRLMSRLSTYAVAPRGDAVDGMALVASQGPVPRCALGHRCELTLERWQSQRTSSCCCPLLRHLKHVSPRSDRREEHESVSGGMA